jgi:hypothetical protein
MPPSFTCSICRQEHEGLPTDWGCKLPDDVWAIPEADRASAARFNEDVCEFGNRWFIRCVLPTPFREAEGAFNWGVWAEVEAAVFWRYVELYKADGNGEPPHAGRLANNLPAYPGALGAEVLIQFREATRRPTLHFSETDDSLLAGEQRSGIDNARYHEILDINSRRGGYKVELTGEKTTGVCECRGTASRRIGGFIHRGEATVAAYFVNWTVGQLVRRFRESPMEERHRGRHRSSPRDRSVRPHGHGVGQVVNFPAQSLRRLLNLFKGERGEKNGLTEGIDYHRVSPSPCSSIS